MTNGTNKILMMAAAKAAADRVQVVVQLRPQDSDRSFDLRGPGITVSEAIAGLLASASLLLAHEIREGYLHPDMADVHADFLRRSVKGALPFAELAPHMER